MRYYLVLSDKSIEAELFKTTTYNMLGGADANAARFVTFTQSGSIMLAPSTSWHNPTAFLPPTI